MMDALEQAIRKVVKVRIDTDPDVAGCYLRLDPGAFLYSLTDKRILKSQLRIRQ